MKKPKRQYSALDLFPDLFTRNRSSRIQAALALQNQRMRADRRAESQPDIPEESRAGTPIPQPPDISWLSRGLSGLKLTGRSASKLSMVFISQKQHRVHVVEVLSGLGYLTHAVDNPVDAIAHMQLHTYSVVIGDIADVVPDFQVYLDQLPMTKRRYIFYALIGAELRTLYNLEALAKSVNLVIGHGDLPYLKKILLVGFGDYANLFGPLLEVLDADYPLLS